MRKKLYVMLAACAMAGLVLTGCGGGSSDKGAGAGKEETVTEATTEVVVVTENQIELTDDDLFELVFAEAPVHEDDAMDVHIKRNEDGTVIFSFRSVDGDYAYTINGQTGEILDKKQPDKITTTNAKATSFDEDQIFDAIKKYSPVDYAKAQNLKIKKAKDLSYYEVTFSTSDGDFYYKLDGKTGDLLDKKEPDHISEKNQIAEQDDDPYGAAISACVDYVGVDMPNAKNIHVKEIGKGDGKKIQVTFDSDGKSYDLIYDPSSGKVEKN